MTSLDDTLKAIAENPEKGIFVSRSGTEKQRELALWVAATLKAHGYIPVVQDVHFKRENFRLAMDRTLASGARALALVSREFLDSTYCMEEATTAYDIKLAGKNRLVVLNIDGCEPLGLLRNVDRVNFHKVWKTRDGREMERTLLAALADPVTLDGSIRIPAPPDADQIIHAAVLDHDKGAFKGREEELKRLYDTLWAGGQAALTRAGASGLLDEAALHGSAGVGKTTLARAYAWRHRAQYTGVWWIRAEREATLIDDLIELGARDMPQLARWEDRKAAAQTTLRRIAESGVNQPWLLVFDNAPGPGALAGWRPARNAHVLVTSRNPAWDAAVPLDVMKPEAAIDFLCATAARRQPKDREEAAALAHQLGYLPLALAHAASRCRGNRRIGFADYGRRLQEFWDDKPGHGATHRHYGRSVYATFTMALDEIVKGGPDGDPSPCRQAETVMGVLAHLAPEQVPTFMLAPLYDGRHTVMTEADLDRALEALAAAGLVTWGAFDDGAPHLGVHRLVQEIMRARLKEREEADDLAALATKLVECTFDGTGSIDAINSRTRWLPQATAVIEHSPKAGPAAWHTIWTLLQVGDLNVERGSLKLALSAYQGAEAIARGSGLERDLSASHNKIGDVLVAQGSLPAALDAYRASLAIRQRLAAADPGNAGWQRDLSVSHGRIGDVLVAQGSLPAALDAYRASLAIRQRLAAADPGNAGWQFDLGISNERLGDVLMAQGILADALKRYETKRDIIARLAAADPGNTEWQRDLSVSHNKIGDVLRAQGNLPAALDAYRASLAIAERLAAADPGNAGWQRDLSVSHNKIGDVLVAQGNLPAALDAYRASLAIAERLAKADPGNAGWQRDLSVSHDRIGDVLRAQGNLPAALDAYRASLAIRQRLAAADPGNAGWQHDVALSLQRVGIVAARQGQIAEARATYERGLAIMEKLVALAPTHAGFKRDLDWFTARLAELNESAGNVVVDTSLDQQVPEPRWTLGGRSWFRRLLGRG